MSNSVKIAIIGDFNFSYNSHHATNLSLEHSQMLLELEVNYYWIRIAEAANMKQSQFLDYDGIWFAPGPFENAFFLSNIINKAISSKIPTLFTGDSFKSFVELLVANFNLNPNNEKLISDNLVGGDVYNKIEVYPVSEALTKMYETHGKTELSSTRYSLYPQLISYLKDDVVDIEALNQFEEPEVISLKNHPFCVASMFSPQICSTREMPHPLITAFINLASQLDDLSNS